MSNICVLSLLGEGTRAAVYAAVDRTDGQVVALKKFHAGMEASAVREFELVSTFTHANLLIPKSLKEEGLLLPYCPGRSVECLFGTFREEVAWQLLSQIASALDYLEGKGYCHGGVCPSNILWNGKSFLLSGFGGCHRIGTSRDADNLQDYRYLPPEGLEDGKSDVWSLAASVFALVLGSAVFNGLGGKAQQAASPVPYLRKSMPELSGLLCRCLAFLPSGRPSARELSEEAESAFKRCLEKKPIRPLKPLPERRMLQTEADFWPDSMTDY